MSRPMLTPDVLRALHGALPRRAVSVWVFLWASASKDTAKTWPGTRTIAEAVGTTRSHVSEDLRELAEKGWLTIEKQPGRGNQYVVVSPTAPGCTRDGTPPEGLYPTRDTPRTRDGTPRTQKRTLPRTLPRTRRARALRGRRRQRSFGSRPWRRWRPTAATGKTASIQSGSLTTTSQTVGGWAASRQ